MLDSVFMKLSEKIRNVLNLSNHKNISINLNKNYHNQISLIAIGSSTGGLESLSLLKSDVYHFRFLLQPNSKRIISIKNNSIFDRTFLAII